MHQMNITSSVIKILSCDIIYRAFRDCETLLPGNDLAVRIRCGNVTVSLYGLGTDTLLFFSSNFWPHQKVLHCAPIRFSSNQNAPTLMRCNRQPY